MTDTPTTASLAGSRLAAIDVDDYRLTPQLLARLITPALVIYEREVEHNIARIISLAGDDPLRWRVHLKTTKTPEIYAMLVAAGLRAFKCATVREAQCMLEVLAERAVHDADLLIAYPLQGPAIARAQALARQFPRTSLSILSEDAKHAQDLPDGLGVFVDVNPGMHRTGIPLDDRARIEAVAHAAGPRLRGLHAYDGHIHQPTADGRRAAAHAVYERLIALERYLRESGTSVAEIVTSGTPSFRYALDFTGFDGGRVTGSDAVHRVSPGTVVFHDMQYDDLLEDLDLRPAALVLARVVSHPRTGIATCDAGSKSIAAECGDPVGFALGQPHFRGLSPSEEHLPFDVSDASATPALGCVLHLVPRHICPTVNLAERALLVARDGAHRVVEVRGRAHELLLDAQS